MADFAVIDYSSTVEGKPTEEFLGKSAGYLSGREGFWVRLDEKAFLPGFAAQLVGMNAGDTKEITITLPEDFPVADLQNRELVFTTTLKELKEAILPELDDELAGQPRSRQNDRRNHRHHPREHAARAQAQDR